MLSSFLLGILGGLIANTLWALLVYAVKNLRT